MLPRRADLPACGRENPDGFRHCGFCGAALTAPAAERRKLATLVFCDMTGSTAMGERVDAETVGGLMLSYFEEMRGALERHGGTVEKFVGDAVAAPEDGTGRSVASVTLRLSQR